MNILVVDDEIRICKMLKEMLTDMGHTVVIIDRSSHALNLIRTKIFDVIILDILMDEIMGIDVLKQIREMGSQIKIIILTSIDDEGIQKYVTNLKIEKYIIKPPDLKNIKHTLNETLSSLSKAA